MVKKEINGLGFMSRERLLSSFRHFKNMAILYSWLLMIYFLINTSSKQLAL